MIVQACVYLCTGVQECVCLCTRERVCVCMWTGAQVCVLTQQVPLILLDGLGQVQRDVPQPDWLREVILDSCAAISNTCAGETLHKSASLSWIPNSHRQHHKSNLAHHSGHHGSDWWLYSSAP